MKLYVSQVLVVTPITGDLINAFSSLRRSRYLLQGLFDALLDACDELLQRTVSGLEILTHAGQTP